MADYPLRAQEVMEARELRTTSSLMTIVVLAGITGFLTLVVLKNTLQARFDEGPPRQSAHALVVWTWLPPALSKGTWRAGLRSLSMRVRQVASSVLAPWG